MPRRYTRVSRLLKVITFIQTGKYNARDIARECGTTLRTVYRDLNMLEGAGIPYAHDAERGVYHMRKDFFLPPLELTLEEALSLLVLAEQTTQGAEIAFMKPAAKAAAKIRSQLPSRVREQLSCFDGHIHIDLARSIPADGIRDAYEDCRAAIANRRALCCTYESSKHPRPSTDCEEPFILRPYCLFWGQRAWYVIGHHSRYNEVRCLKLNRFTAIERTRTPFAVPIDFSLAQYLGNAWRMIRGPHRYRIELHFDAAFAETVADTHWHDTQEIDWSDDGSIRFCCEVDGLDEITWWILSMGPHCQVLKPAVLARRVCDLAAATAVQYKQPRRGMR